jgi:hypothetical protein
MAILKNILSDAVTYRITFRETTRPTQSLFGTLPPANAVIMPSSSGEQQIISGILMCL